MSDGSSTTIGGGIIGDVTTGGTTGGSGGSTTVIGGSVGGLTNVVATAQIIYDFSNISPFLVDIFSGPTNVSISGPIYGNVNFDIVNGTAINPAVSYVAKSNESQEYITSELNEFNSLKTTLKIRLNQKIPLAIENGKAFSNFFVYLTDTSNDVNISMNTFVTNTNTNVTFNSISTNTPGEKIYSFNVSYSNFTGQIEQNDIEIIFDVPQNMSSTLFRVLKVTGTLVSQSALCLHPDTLVKTKRGNIKVADLITDDIVYDEKENPITVKFVGTNDTTNKFVKFTKGSLGENIPNNDLYITPGHMIMFNGKVKEASSFINNKDIIETDVKDSKVCSIITDNIEYVSCEGVYCATKDKSEIIKILNGYSNAYGC